MYPMPSIADARASLAYRRYHYSEPEAYSSVTTSPPTSEAPPISMPRRKARLWSFCLPLAFVVLAAVARHSNPGICSAGLFSGI